MIGSALLLGLMGSLHCIAMCSPIALMLKSKNNINAFILSRVIYNLGRTTTYGILGLLVGSLGFALEIFGIQYMISIVSGVVLIIIAVTHFAKLDLKTNYHPLRQLHKLFNTAFGRLYRKPSLFSSYAMGLVNGILPCGLVYAALPLAFSGGTIESAVLYMVLFGLGTIPVMLFVSISGKVLNLTSKFRYQTVLNGFALLAGIILIIRGMQLDIPYLSPILELIPGQNKNITTCS